MIIHKGGNKVERSKIIRPK